jgi:hypothetical protein
MGLTKEAHDFLQTNCPQTPFKVCPKCKEVISQSIHSKQYASAKHCGMFDDGPELFEYTIQDGSKVKEVVQASPWSSGPCIFLCLEQEDGKHIFEWSQEQINNA